MNCPGLPTTSSDIQPALRAFVANSTDVEKDFNVTVTIVSGPFFTCRVQGTAFGTYQEVSLIVIYHFNQDHNNKVSQFEMECIEISGDRQWYCVSYSLSVPGVNYTTTISLWTNCSECASISPPNENHCQCEFQSFLKHSIMDH